MLKRSSGILLHISSLPGKYGIGAMGQAAYDFIDFLSDAGQSFWQVLPLGHTGYGDSPYQCFSSFAGNPYFIDLDTLCKQGLITQAETASLDFGNDPDFVDYGKIYENRYKVLRSAYKNKDKIPQEKYLKFCEENRLWLDDYALFMSIKADFGNVTLSSWPDDDIKKRTPEALKKYSERLADETGFYKFMQYLFFEQWEKLHKYAKEKKIGIIGDIPIYVSADSADVWTNPQLFKLDEDLQPAFVAGVPPDNYSATGQLWGNPVYDWAEHEKDGYKWWLGRIGYNLKMFDVLRIDHFRGFCKYWEVPGGSENAMNGVWRDGPKMKLFAKVNEMVDENRIIVEDLGVVTPDLKEFLEESGYPGMKNFVFAFDAKNHNNEHMPHCLKENCVAYTSTHDSPPFRGVVEKTFSKAEREQALRYINMRDPYFIGTAAIRSLWASRANLVMAQMQDVLSLTDDSTMNRPSVPFGNWRWRVRGEALNQNVRTMLNEVTEDFGRLSEENTEAEENEEAAELKGESKCPKEV